MTKRRAEDTLFCGIPSKRGYGSLCSLDMRLKGSAASGAVNPPSLLALLGSRCRKRPHSFEEADEQETSFSRNPANNDMGSHALNRVTGESCSSYQDGQASSTQSSARKRPRGRDVSQKTFPEVATADDNTNNSSSDDISYNSFQFWRIPLPVLDLSLLEGTDAKPSRKHPTGKDPLDAMET